MGALYGTGEGAVGVDTGAVIVEAGFVGAVAAGVGVGGAEAAGVGARAGAAVEVPGSVLILGVSLGVGVLVLELLD